MGRGTSAGRTVGECRSLLAGALLLASFLAGCAQRPAPKPPEPERQAKRSEPRRLEPLHVAPPPEYGNKVVLARDDDPTLRF